MGMGEKISIITTGLHNFNVSQEKKLMVTQLQTKKHLSPKGGWLGLRREIWLEEKEIGTEKTQWSS